MTVKDTTAYDKGVADFFGDQALAEKFAKLVKVEDKLKMMWNSRMIQVISFQHCSDCKLNEILEILV